METRLWTRFALAVLVVLGGLAGFAVPALAGGTVTVNIVGAGHVTGSLNGIDCTRNPAGVVTGTCSELVVEGQDCEDGPPCTQIPGETALSATAVADFGFGFDSFSGGGCNLRTPLCSMTIGFVTDNRNVTVTFPRHPGPDGDADDADGRHVRRRDAAARGDGERQRAGRAARLLHPRRGGDA
jgi:hypothetical protein